LSQQWSAARPSSKHGNCLIEQDLTYRVVSQQFSLEFLKTFMSWLEETPFLFRKTPEASFVGVHGSYGHMEPHV